MKKALLLISLNLMLNIYEGMAQQELQKIFIFSPLRSDTSYTYAGLPKGEYTTLRSSVEILTKIIESRPLDIHILLPVEQDSALVLLLRRSDNYMPDIKLAAGNEMGDRFLHMDVISYYGSVEGIKDSWVSFTISNLGCRATMLMNGETLVLSPLALKEKTLSDVHLLHFCSERSDQYPDLREDIIQPAGPKAVYYENNNFKNESVKISGNKNLLPSDTIVVKIAVESDYDTYVAFNENTDQAMFYLLSLFSAVSQIYEREVKIKLMLSYVRVWETPDDPYSSSTTSAGQLVSEFTDYWINNMQHVNRNIAHYHTKRQTWLTAMGLSGGGSLCTNNLYSFSREIDIEINAIAIYLVAHEIGHNFNAPHTHECAWPVGPGNTPAPIDLCGNNCTGITEYINGGTIMSYCGQQTPMVFHPLCKILIRNVAQSSTCVGDGTSESFTVSGKVTIGDNGLPGVNVAASLDGHPIAQTLTDSNGNYKLSLPVNAYDIDARLSGYAIFGRGGPNHAYVALAADINGVDYTATIVPPDKYEPDNNIYESRLINTDGTIQYHTVNHDRDWDYLKFNGIAGDTISISNHPGEEGIVSALEFLVFYLFDSDRKTIITKSSSYPQVNWIVPRTDTYYLGISSSVGSYGVSITSSGLATFIPDQSLPQLKVYPNPADDYLVVETLFEGQYLIEINSLEGRTSFQTEMIGSLFRLDVSSLQQGIYTLTIKSENYKQTERIIIY